MIPTELLRILVCPETKQPLLLTPDGDLVSVDSQSRRLYRVEDDIPILLIDESKVLTPEEHSRVVESSRQVAANKTAGKA